MHTPGIHTVPRSGKTLQIAGFSFSRPLSRILSRVTIPLGRELPHGSSGVPDPSAGRLNGICFTLHRTGFDEPPCHHDAGGLLPHRFTLTAEPPEMLRRRFAFCSTFRRLSPPGISPASCPVVSGLSSAAAHAANAVTRPAPRILARIAGFRGRRRAACRTRGTRARRAA
jgi:hypothetical protein